MLFDYYRTLDDSFYGEIDRTLRETMAEKSYSSYTFEDTVSVAMAKLPPGFVAWYGQETVINAYKMRIGVVAGLRTDYACKPATVTATELNHALDEGTPLTELLYSPGETVPEYVVQELPGTEDERTLTVETHDKGEPLTIIDQATGEVSGLRTAQELIDARTKTIGPDWLIDVKETILGTREAGTYGEVGGGLFGKFEKGIGYDKLTEWLSNFKMPGFDFKIPFGSFYIIAGIILLIVLAVVLWSPGGQAAGHAARGAQVATSAGNAGGR